MEVCAVFRRTYFAIAIAQFSVKTGAHANAGGTFPKKSGLRNAVVVIFTLRLCDFVFASRATFNFDFGVGPSLVTRPVDSQI
jgi:hypothetical protein